MYCRNVKAKSSQRDLESTLVEVDDKENLLSRLLWPLASPVVVYVKNNPAPPLVQIVKGKSSQRDLESTRVEVDDKENLLV